MSQQAISTADLRTIENNLATIYQNIQVLDSSVTTVNKNVTVVYDELGALARDFQAYIVDEKRRWELENATTRLGNVRQELETKYGHYSEVRRTATGILQATDLGIVHEEQIVAATEELMLSCPGYWLAPALVALASWINDRKDIADKALREALRRDEEKATLFFGLVCRRADRKTASLRWMKRYLLNQDPKKLGRETIVVLDAYAAGLFSNDSENAIAQQLADWLEVLSAEPGFMEKQSKSWKIALEDKKKPISTSSYFYLRQYSHTWPVLESILEGAYLHQTVLEYFEKIFAQPSSQEAVKKQLDEILMSLVTGFDDEELPLRREERLCQLIINFDGDVTRARSSADAEKSALEEEKDFTQMLTDAAMYPETTRSSVSSQKFAIAYSRDWIQGAYSDLVLENRMKVPSEIEINIDTFDDKTTDGSDEPRLVAAFETLVQKERTEELDKAKLTAFEEYCKIGGFGCLGVGAAAILGYFVLGTGLLLGILAVIAGVGLVMKHYSRKKAIDAQRKLINKKYDEKLEKGLKILKATIAEIVDFRSEFDRKDKESEGVVRFLSQISPEQYVRSLGGSARKITA